MTELPVRLDIDPAAEWFLVDGREAFGPGSCVKSGYRAGGVWAGKLRQVRIPGAEVWRSSAAGASEVAAGRRKGPLEWDGINRGERWIHRWVERRWIQAKLG